MSFFNQYPYINLNDLNLDFILNAIKEMRNEVTNFVSINAIKYADPIQWNITSQYEKNTIVIDPQTGTAYISVAPVPSGVALTRDEYWSVVFDLGSFVTRAAKNFTTRYEQDTTTTATFNSVAGDWLVWGDTLYIANVNITAGDSYVVDGNIRRITVEEVKDAIMQLIADNYDTIIAMIGDLDDLTTENKTNLVAAINEVLTLAQNTFNSVVPLPILDVTKHGVSTDNADNSTALQDCINRYANAYKIYIPDGTYDFTSGITLPDAIRLQCDGTLNFAIGSDNVAITSIGLDQIVNIANIVSDGDGFLVYATTKTLGRSEYFLPRIVADGDGIILRSNGVTQYVGVQKCNFHLNSITAGRYGILLNAVATNFADWVNENNFYDMWIVANASAIKFIKGSNQTDKYNGNRFINFTTENSAKAIDIDFANYNIFNNFRTLEIVGASEQITATFDTEYNTFNSDSGLNDVQINDSGTGNYYFMQLWNSNHSNVICNAFTYRWGEMLPLNTSFFTSLGLAQEVVDITTQLENKLLNSITISNSTANSITVRLPIYMDYAYDWRPVFIHVGRNIGGVTLISYVGTFSAQLTANCDYVILGGKNNNDFLLIPLTTYAETETINLTPNSENIYNADRVSVNSIAIKNGLNYNQVISKYISFNMTMKNFGVIATGDTGITNTSSYPVIIDGKMYVLTINSSSISISDPLNNGIPSWSTGKCSLAGIN